MLTLYTQQTHLEEVKQFLKGNKGLKQYLAIQPIEKLGEAVDSFHLILDEGMIHLPLNWENTEPPILFSPQPITPQNLLTFVMLKLAHYDWLHQQQPQGTLKQEIEQFLWMIFGNGSLQPNATHTFTSQWNATLLLHFSTEDLENPAIKSNYETCYNNAPTEEVKAFVGKQFSEYLSNINQVEEAISRIEQTLKNSLPERAMFALKQDYVGLLMKKITIPYNSQIIGEIKESISECLAYFEEHKQEVQMATMLTYASEIAQMEKSYSEALGYANKAIDIYEAEALETYLASAFMQKATVLFHWAQDGNPQFYKPASETYQKALRVFTKENAPYVFAEIQHHLGIIYAEMPSDGKQYQIWAAVSASSFQESLRYFTKEQFPYEHALVLNNYANAIMKYPDSKNSDNYEKALTCFFEVLDIRTAEDYPMERAHTILNYLEACWRVHNVNSTMERVRLKDMLAKAKEVKTLVEDTELHAQAEEHIVHLTQLSTKLMEVKHA